MNCRMDRVGESSNVSFCKCNIVGFRLGRKFYHYTLPFPLLWRYWIWKTVKVSRMHPGSLKICALSPPPFCSAHFHVDSWARSRLHNLLSAITDTNKLQRLKSTSSMARFSQEWDVTIFLRLAIGISLRWKKLSGFFWGGEGVEGCGCWLHLHSVILEISPTGE